MLNIAFCFQIDTELFYIEGEINKFFERRGLSVATYCCRNADELLKLANNTLPDMLFYNPEDEGGRTRRAALAIKKHHKNMVSVVTASNGYTLSDNDSLLEPLYLVPNKSRKQLWLYAGLAYEAVMNDEEVFEYYRRPSYIKLPVGEIKYFASDARRTHIISEEGTDAFYKKLDDVERLVQNKSCRFLRIHKSYLVNTQYIEDFGRFYVKLTNGECLRVSKYEYYKGLVEAL